MIKSIFIFLAIFISGVICAAFTTTLLMDKLWQEKEYFLGQSVKSYEVVRILNEQIANVSALDAGEKNKIYERACVVFDLFIRHLDIQEYADFPGRQKEIIDTKEKAINTYKILKARGACDDIKIHLDPES